MFQLCEICDVVVEKSYIQEAKEYGCPYCWDAYSEVH